MKVHGWILVAVCAAVAGCAAVGDPSLAKMMGAGAQMEQWKDKHRDELAKDPAWGKPSEERPLKEGGAELVYNRPYKMPTQHFKFEQACQMIFRTDSQGIVRSWTYTGC